MKHRLFLFLVTIFFCTIGLAQSGDTVFIRQIHDTDHTSMYLIDTIVFKNAMAKQILIGTTILPSTHNQMRALEYGISLRKVIKSDCQRNGDRASPDRINSIISTDSTLIVDINITDNCCYEFLNDISVDSTGTINLIYYGYGSYCACECCFGLTFYFSKIKDLEYSDIKAIMINNDSKTVKKIRE